MKRVLFDSQTNQFVEKLLLTFDHEWDCFTTPDLSKAYDFSGHTEEAKEAFEDLNKEEWKKDPSHNRFYFKEV